MNTITVHGTLEWDTSKPNIEIRSFNPEKKYLHNLPFLLGDKTTEKIKIKKDH